MSCNSFEEQKTIGKRLKEKFDQKNDKSEEIINKAVLKALEFLEETLKYEDLNDNMITVNHILFEPIAWDTYDRRKLRTKFEDAMLKHDIEVSYHLIDYDNVKIGLSWKFS